VKQVKQTKFTMSMISDSEDVQVENVNSIPFKVIH